MLQSEKNLLFQRLYHELAVVYNNNKNGIKCSQGTIEDDFKHIDIRYNNGETEDCKYCGKKGIFLTEGVLKSETTWISTIISQYDYKIKRSKIYDNYKDKLILDENRNEYYIYIPIDDIKKLASKQIKLNDDCLEWYEKGKNLTYYQNSKNSETICKELQELYERQNIFK